MKVYVEMDYLQNRGSDYLSASYRDFVPEGIEIRKIVGKHLKAIVRIPERIKEISRGIENLEAIATQPIRTYIEHQIEEGLKMTPSYFMLRERGLKVRKQTFLQYWHAIKEGWREEPEEEEIEEYYPGALTAIHKWLTRELQNAFGGWGIDRDYEVNEASEFTATYKARTFEFGLIRTAHVHPQNVAYEETYYYMVFNNNSIQAYEMWKGFDYMGFNREMRRIGAWK